MGVVKVHPQKKLLLVILVQPVERDIGDDIARPLHFINIRFLQPAEIEMIVVKIEAVVQAKT